MAISTTITPVLHNFFLENGVSLEVLQNLYTYLDSIKQPNDSSQIERAKYYRKQFLIMLILEAPIIINEITSIQITDLEYVNETHSYKIIIKGKNKRTLIL